MFPKTKPPGPALASMSGSIARWTETDEPHVGEVASVRTGSNEQVVAWVVPEGDGSDGVAGVASLKREFGSWSIMAEVHYPIDQLRGSIGVTGFGSSLWLFGWADECVSPCVLAIDTHIVRFRLDVRGPLLFARLDGMTLHGSRFRWDGTPVNALVLLSGGHEVSRLQLDSG